MTKVFFDFCEKSNIKIEDLVLWMGIASIVLIVLVIILLVLQISINSKYKKFMFFFNRGYDKMKLLVFVGRNVATDGKYPRSEENV